MGKLQPGIAFTGTFGGISFYKRQDVEEIIVRSKGGPAKGRVKKDPAYINTRRNNAEFGGRSTGSSLIKRMLHPLDALTWNSFTGRLNKILVPAQQADSQGEWGSRSVLLSACPGLLAGFNLNQTDHFDSMLRNPPVFQLDKSSLSATIDIPALLPGINFMVPAKYGFFCFQAVLGLVPDLHLNTQTNKYQAAAHYENQKPVLASSNWLPVGKKAAAINLQLSYPTAAPDAGFTLMLSLGISFGMPGSDNDVEQVIKAGAAKILSAI